jgi:hypothetical protein
VRCSSKGEGSTYSVEEAPLEDLVRRALDAARAQQVEADVVPARIHSAHDDKCGTRARTHRGRSGNMPATVSTMPSLTRFGVKPSARAPGLSPPAPRT